MKPEGVLRCGRDTFLSPPSLGEGVGWGLVDRPSMARLRTGIIASGILASREISTSLYVIPDAPDLIFLRKPNITTRHQRGMIVKITLLDETTFLIIRYLHQSITNC